MNAATDTLERGRSPRGGASDADDAPWYAVWTRSNCEQLVHDQLDALGHTVLLPKVVVPRRQGRDVVKPLFAGYVFVRTDLDRQTHVGIVSARGVVRVLCEGAGWDRPLAIPEQEIAAVLDLLDRGVPVRPHPYLNHGARVRIQSGALAGLEGILVRDSARHGRVVLSVDLLRRSVAVEIDGAQVVPA